MNTRAAWPLLRRSWIPTAPCRWHSLSAADAMTTRPAPASEAGGSSSSGADGGAPSSKRARIAPAVPVAPYSAIAADAPPLEEVLAVAHAEGRECPVPFRTGLFLAPMVRSGTLPTRLLSLQYGASLVWGPEIVDRAIMGCIREVNEQTGLVSFIKDGKEIFTTHPVERKNVIFQLGSANAAWAYEAIKFVTAHDDVAGVDLNCGCPKPFSTIGGMGAHLLTTPDILCDVLRAMRRAAPPHVSVSCKIRLLPSREATQALVRQILRLGIIDNLTVHCRTKEMRPREPALLDRLREVVEIVREETGGALPLCCNGDAWDWKEAKRIMEMTGVTSIMIARGAEANPSCFAPSGVSSISDVIAPQYVRYAAHFDNNFSNSKFCMMQMTLKPSSNYAPHAPILPNARSKQQLLDVRHGMERAKTMEEMAAVFGVDLEKEVRGKTSEEILAPVRRALEARENAELKPDAELKDATERGAEVAQEAVAAERESDSAPAVQEPVPHRPTAVA